MRSSFSADPSRCLYVLCDTFVSFAVKGFWPYPISKQSLLAETASRAPIRLPALHSFSCSSTSQRFLFFLKLYPAAQFAEINVDLALFRSGVAEVK